MSSFDVRIFALRRRAGRRVFEVRWRVAGQDKSRSFITQALADSYRAELVRAARKGAEFDPATVASPEQVRAILAHVACIRPELAAFFGCLYYAALRPEEAVALRRDDLTLPAHGRGTLILTTACPRTGTAWTSTGRPHEPAASSTAPTARSGLSPYRPSWSACCAVTCAITAPRQTGGCSAAPAATCSANRPTGRSWHTAHQAALGPELAATALARRPYDLRHAALSLWLNASGTPPRLAHQHRTHSRFGRLIRIGVLPLRRGVPALRRRRQWRSARPWRGTSRIAVRSRADRSQPTE